MEKQIVEHTMAAELRHYLSMMQWNVEKETDIAEWWQKHTELYPTLAHVTLDVLPSQASSVPSKQVFLGVKQGF
ncbi:hypothetical protein K443DRAFT_13787 [Laccaria amethystina LaAM-08-1]|uniref:HAT C-terminal dimerisation domain-containing protein n=1 Tax=Laccaria amethystina LaAM-08-1 TaxID=1095629 RepID=A0A0C9WNR6_9AGAR|nr:hypothetical protein K443DRAFT_13787 [Laccaria amethystina LaAM-08-1]